jgi:hypothetical protein
MEITGEIKPGYEQILTPEALALVAKLTRAFEPRRQELLAARVERAKRLDAGERPDFLPETAHIRAGRLEDRADSAGAGMPPRRDHRPGRAQDGHQRLELGRRQLHDRLRGFEHAELGQPDHRPDQHARRRAPHDLAGTERQDLQAERQDRDPGRAPARLAPRRKARAGRRQAHLGRHLRLRAVHVPQREGAAGARRRPVLLPAEDGIAPRSAPVERHLRDDAKGSWACRRARSRPPC